jgi:1,2-diacylglycerol 3-beta-glucosyltransferase
MILHTCLFALTALVSTVAFISLLYVVFLALVGSAGKRQCDSPSIKKFPRTRFVMLIPAHNEEHGIGPTLESVRALNYPPDLLRVIVVADNCSDRTADVVRGMGTECWERTALSAPGKGQALRWALERLPPESVDAVAFVDADSRVDTQFLLEMDRGIQEGAAALQGQYEFDLADSSNFSMLMFASKQSENNLFWRPRQRFGWPGFIVGNGFCLSRQTIESVPWAAYSIVEDVEYSIQLALRNFPVRFIETARVSSRPTRRVADAGPQRLRWASGTFQVMRQNVPKLVRAGVRQRSLQLVEMAMALILTSRFLAVYLLLVASLGSVALGANGVALYLRFTVIASFLLLAIYLGTVFSQIPKTNGSRLKPLVALPLYTCWMLLIHIAAAVGLRRDVWVRTAR